MIERIFRMFPEFKGKQRLARFVFKNKIKFSKDITVRGKYGCRYAIPNIKEGIGFEIFINGIYEKDTIDLVVKSIPENGVVIDIGANIGAIIVPVLKKRNDINAFCIEASKKVFGYLEENIRQNQIQNCKTFNRAISSEDGLTVSFFSPEALYGKGSMSPVFSQEAVDVKTITLDALVSENRLDKVSLIKIDVEGYEYHAFKGGYQLLSGKEAPDIILEFVDWAEAQAAGTKPGDAQKLLFDYGYKLFKLDNRNQLFPMFVPCEQGSMMLWATKK